MKKFLLSVLCMAGAMTSAYAYETVFDFTGDEGYGMELLSGSTSAYNPDPCTLEQDSVVITLTGGTRWWKTSTQNELRMYKQSALSIQAPEGKHIDKVELNAKATANFTGDGYSAGTWSGNCSTVDISCTISSSNTPIYSITVTYSDGEGTGEVDTPTPVEKTKLTALSEAYSMASGDDYEVDVDLTVVYASGAYTYVYDGTSYGLIFKYNLNLSAGDVIAKGWTGTISIYNKLVELVPDDTISASSTGASLPEPTEVTSANVADYLTAANQNTYLKLVDVVFDDVPTTTTFNGTMGDTTVVFYNRFSVLPAEAGTYTVTGFVSVYNSTVQFYGYSFDKTAAISSISSENAAARYYNLQGVEVANPQSGNVYIKVAGNKATKVIR